MWHYSRKLPTTESGWATTQMKLGVVRGYFTGHNGVMNSPTPNERSTMNHATPSPHPGPVITGEIPVPRPSKKGLVGNCVRVAGYGWAVKREWCGRKGFIHHFNRQGNPVIELLSHSGLPATNPIRFSDPHGCCKVIDRHNEIVYDMVTI